MNTHTRATALTNTSTRVSHPCGHICPGGMFYDVIIRYRHRIALFCVPVTGVLVSAYNEDDLAGESWYTRFWFLYSDCAYNECANNELLNMYMNMHMNMYMNMHMNMHMNMYMNMKMGG